MTDELSMKCEGLITVSELKNSLNTFDRNKTPGSDGLPFEFYLTFWEDIEHILLDSFNYSYYHGKLSITQRQGILSIIPKKGKDCELLKNWRPLSLLNFDYKLLTKCLSIRLKKVLPNIIHRDQTGFLKGRYIGENINKVLNIASVTKIKNQIAYLMTVDFEKAFDFLEFKHIEKTLNFYNFGPMMRTWLKVIYNDISSCVINNGWISEFFSITRGVRQGCPLSPYLFIIAVEILAHRIRENGEIEGIKIKGVEHKIALYADDTILFLTGGESSIRTALNVFQDFQCISGLKINIEKTHIMPFGKYYMDKDMICDLGLQWTTGPVNILGINMEHTFTKLYGLNFVPKMEIAKQQIQLWLKRDMTPMGRITILKSHIMSQLVYLISNLPTPPKSLFEELKKISFKFIWSGKTEKIKRNYLLAERYEAGLDVPYLPAQNKAVKIGWLHRLLNEGKNNNFFNMVNYFFRGRLEYILTCNLAKKDCNVLLKGAPAFWIQVLEAWAEFNFSKPKDKVEILTQSIWYNSNIKIDNQVVCYKYWFNKGIKYIHNIVEWNIEKQRYCVLTCKEVNNKFNCNISQFAYCAIVDAIPVQWREDLKSVNMKLDVVSNYKIDRLVKMTKVTKFVSKCFKKRRCRRTKDCTGQMDK